MSIPMLRSIAVAAWSAILIVCLAPAGVAAPLVVDGRTSRYSLSSAAEFVEAASCAVEPGEAFARGTARRSEGEAPNFGMSRSAMWARVDIDWQASADRNWWLVVRQGVVDEVRVVLPAAGIAARDLRSGIAVDR